MTSAPPPAPPTADPRPWQPLPPSGPPDRPQLRRSRTDKVLGGVNGGLAEYTGIDALLWRVGFVALTLAAGTGVLVYLLLWLLMPAGTDEPGSPGTYRRSPARRDRAPAGPRSPVPGITIAVLLIAVGALVLISRLTGWDVAGTGYLGTALLVVGLGLVAAALLPGRHARGGLLALGVVLALALAISSAEPWNDPDVGDRTYRVSSVAEVREVYQGNVGELTIDLSEVPMDGLDGPVVTRVEQGFGDLEVIVPRSADVRVTVDSGLGDVTVFGDDDDGFFAGTGRAEWTGDDEAELELTVHAGIGDVEVSRG